MRHCLVSYLVELKSNQINETLVETETKSMMHAEAFFHLGGASAQPVYGGAPSPEPFPGVAAEDDLIF